MFLSSRWASYVGGLGIYRCLQRLVVGRPYDGRPASAGNGSMVALLASDRRTVDAVHAVAQQQGGVDEGAPGLRPEYHSNYYGAYFRDLDGKKLCVVTHSPEIE